MKRITAFFLAPLLFTLAATTGYAMIGGPEAKPGQMVIQGVGPAESAPAETAEPLRQSAPKTPACERVQSRVNFRLQTIEKNKDRYMDRYQGIQSRLTDLADKLDQKGCDTRVVRADIAQFKTLTQEFATSFREFNGYMQKVRGAACEPETASFGRTVRQAGTQVTALRQSAIQVRSFFETTLINHLRQTAQTCQAIEGGN